MSNIWDIAMNQVRLLTKNRVVVIVMLTLPLMFVFLFSLMFGDTYDNVDGTASTALLAIADRDGSWLASRLQAELEASPGLQLRPIEADAADRLFRDKEITYLLTIPPGWGEALLAADPVELRLASAPGSQGGPLLEAHVQQAALRTVTAMRLAGLRDETVVTPAAFDAVRAQIRQGQVTLAFQSLASSGAATPLKANLQLTSGFTIMFVMSLLFGRAGALLKERQDGTLRRLLTAPVSRLQLLAGYLLSFFVVGTAQFTLLALLGRLLFRVEWGPPLQVAFIMFTAVAAAAGLSLFLATLVRTPEQQSVLGTIVLISTCMLGGVFWPLDIVSPLMRRIAQFVPQSWAMDGLRKVATGAAWGELIAPAGMLLLFAAVFLAVGLPRIRYE